MGVGDVIKNVANRLVEARDRAQEQDLAAKNKREMEASAQRIEYEKQIREKQMQAKITPEMAEKRRQENAQRYESNIKTTGEKAKEAVGALIKPASDIRQRNIMRMEKQPTDRPLTRSEVQRMIAKKQTGQQQKGGQKMSSGQFHAPSFGGGPKGGSNMMNLDPFAGIGGTAFGKKKKKGGGGRGGFMDPFNF